MNAKAFLKKILSKDSRSIAKGARQSFDDGGQVQSWEQAKESLPDVSHLQDVTGINFQDPNPLNYAQGAARLADSYTGAPVRSAIGAMGRGQSGAEAYGKQFGENPEHAPTGEQLMEQAGVENKVGKKVGGIALDLMADPLFVAGLASRAGHLAGGLLDKNLTNQARRALAEKILSTEAKWVHQPTKDLNEFKEAYEAAAKESPIIYQNTSNYPKNELGQFDLYLSKDKMSGYLIKPDGEIGEAFSRGKQGRLKDIMSEGLMRGAKKLDAFEGPPINLPEKYKRYGFLETKRDPNWTPGGPDVVYMNRKPFPAKMSPTERALTTAGPTRELLDKSSRDR